MNCLLSIAVEAVHCLLMLGLQIEVPGEVMNQTITSSMSSNLHTTLHLLHAHDSLEHSAQAETPYSAGGGVNIILGAVKHTDSAASQCFD